MRATNSFVLPWVLPLEIMSATIEMTRRMFVPPMDAEVPQPRAAAIETYLFETLRVGQRATMTRTVTDQDLRDFAKVSGDHNPVHLDEEYALKSAFKGKVAHGLYTAALVSAVLGTRLPGGGTRYRSQTLTFVGSVRPRDTITAIVEIVSIEAIGRLVTLKTTVENQRGKVVLDGIAVVDMPLAA